jgi:hypothetical protein
MLIDTGSRAAPCRIAAAFTFIILLTLTSPLVAIARAQFVDDFNGSAIRADPKAQTGWAFFTGDGKASIELRQGGDGYATILVDATNDRRGIWWALIKRQVSDRMDLRRLDRSEYELRIETRIRVSHAPRRVNLHLNTQRTTDFHSHLMEFDIPDNDNWHTISMTTRDFPAVAGDTVYGQLALIDWGLEKYSVDVDYFRVDVVDVARAGPDKGVAVPYHPPLPDPSTFRQAARVIHDASIDLDNPSVNLNHWYVQDWGNRKHIITVNGTQYVILRFDLSAFAGKQVADHGLLELTTHSVQRSSDPLKDFGLVRVVEVLGGDPRWDQKTVTSDNLRRGQSLNQVFNSQMIIDWPVTEGDGGKTYFTISRPVLQRMLDGRTLGLALKPLGSISAAFYAVEQDGGRLAGRLLFNLSE